MSAEDEEGGVVLATVTVTKTLYDDDIIIDVDHSDGLAVVDAVGMLAFSIHTLMDAPTRDEDDE